MSINSITANKNSITKIAFIVSSKDPAGLNIKEAMRSFGFSGTGEHYDNEEILYKESSNKELKLYTAKKESIYCENIDNEISADMFVFLTMHKSKIEQPLLSAHSPGNWGNAEFGGKSRKLCIAPAQYIASILIKLKEKSEEYRLNYNIAQEVTHHGPYIKKPVLFVEIGSSEKQWHDKKAIHALAESVDEVFCKSKLSEFNDYAIAIGGLHNMPRFTKRILAGEIAISHAMPKYMLNYLDEYAIDEAVRKSLPRPATAVIEWKGLGSNKNKVNDVIDYIEKKGLRIIKLK